MDSSLLATEAEERLQQADSLETAQQLREELERQIARVSQRIFAKCTRESDEVLCKNRKALSDIKRRLKVKMHGLNIHNASNDVKMDVPDNGTSSDEAVDMEKEEEEMKEAAIVSCSKSNLDAPNREIVQDIVSSMNDKKWIEMRIVLDNDSFQIRYIRND